MKLLMLILQFLIICPFLQSAYVHNLPTKLTQANGDVINCFITGDENNKWVHDADGYIIVFDENMNYWVYTDTKDNVLVPSKNVVGKGQGLTKNRIISKHCLYGSNEKYYTDISNEAGDEGFPIGNKSKIFSIQSPKTGSIDNSVNNIVIFAGFKDLNKFDNLDESTFRNDFNNMEEFFKIASNKQLYINDLYQ